MKVAIPIWDGRVSPLMDSACRLLMVDFADNREIGREVVTIPQTDISGRARFIADLGVGILICGAISRPFERMLSALGVRIQPWFRGSVDDVIEAHSGGTLQNDSFFMPGFGRRCHHNGRGRRRQRQSHRQNKE